ncbi:MAG TPA: membrane protein insertion efficiency factor YidD [Candidatus Wallbacteria bacterium]|nr:membrane protein insertion efficiency factor YidD [Candidatus Wallbacteria bacterium]
MQLKIRLLFTLPIIAYQRVFSSNFIPICRFVPSCSEYTRHAILKHGVVRGIFYGALRIVRCNPFFRGGYDPLR